MFESSEVVPVPLSSVEPSRKPKELPQRIGIDTQRGIFGYSRELGFRKEAEFLSYIEGKKVCDVGSGYGSLGVECLLRGVNTEICAVNPNMRAASFQDEQQRKLLEQFGTSYAAEQILAAIAAQNAKTLAVFAHDMRDIPDESQDIVLDNTAVTYYSNLIGEELYRKSILDMMRILKVGGKLRIGDRTRYGTPEEEIRWEEQVLKDLGLQYSVYFAPDDPTLPLGVEVIKK